MTANIKDLSITSLKAKVAELGLKSYAAEQLVIWLYKERATSFEQMSNLGKAARELLAREFAISRLAVETVRDSKDGSRKFLFRLADGEKIESIVMPQKNRLTLCLSTQVGCAMGCRFCRTATMGLLRNLTQGEILDQVLEAQRQLSADQRITNLVFMGMGEPLHNYDAVISALQILRHPKGFGFGKKKITVSTSGLAPAIEKFGKDADVKLALSLNATDDPTRTRVMPVNKKYPMADLQKACRTYNDLTGNAITMEYVLFAGLNDTPEDVKRLAKFLSKLNAKINLIPYNEFPDSEYRRPTEAKVMEFYRALAGRNFQVNIRYSKGLDILGACGQLATNQEGSRSR